MASVRDRIKKSKAEEQAAAKPVEQPEAVAAEAAAEQPAADAPTVRRYRVKHQDCDAAVFDAEDKADAVEQYKAFAGIIATPHPFKVEKL